MKFRQLLSLHRVKSALTRIKQLAAPNASPGVLYRVVDINTDTLEVALKCVYTLTIMKDKIICVIKDQNILASLEPLDACWLGYYYGQAVRNKTDNEIRELTTEVNFLLKHSRGNLQIHSFNRNNTLSYTNKTTNSIHEKYLIDIAADERLINWFDPSQACYIGILAGLNVEKIGKKISKPDLKLIK